MQNLVLILVTGLGAWLLFFIQPLTGQVLTPLMGGSPTSWLLVMLWFQTSLLIGTILSNILSKLDLRIHLGVLTALLIPILFLREPTIYPVNSGFDVLKQLWEILSYGPIMLGMITASTARAYSVRSDSSIIFISSNIGSLLGLMMALLSDMFLDSSVAHSIKYLGFITLVIGLGISTLLAEKAEIHKGLKSFGLLPFIIVAGYAALSCALLNVITTKISTDMGSIPFTWLPPLLLFLITYIFAFWKGVKYVEPLSILCTIALVGILAIPLLQIGNNLGTMLIVLVFTGIIWSALHSFIAKLKPIQPGEQALFTVSISLGGLIGSSITAILFPLLLNSNIDFTLVIILIAFSLSRNIFGKLNQIEKLFCYFVPAVLIIFALSNYEIRGFVLLVFIVLAITLTSRGLGFACLLFALLFHTMCETPIITSSRNYFGHIKVTEAKTDGIKTRTLIHGNTIHGSQKIVNDQFITEPSSYYSKTGPLGDLITNEVENILCIGLGVGTIQGYQKPTMFIELDPDVVKTASNYFGFLNDKSRVIIGDGRLKVKELNETFDLIILDAFSSDAIPLHLLTIEALTEFKARLKPNGRIAVHISNRFYELRPLLAANGNHLGMEVFSKKEGNVSNTASHWVTLQGSQVPAPKDWDMLTSKHKRLWTDTKGSLIWLLKGPWESNNGTKSN